MASSSGKGQTAYNRHRVCCNAAAPTIKQVAHNRGARRCFRATRVTWEGSGPGVQSEATIQHETSLKRNICDEDVIVCVHPPTGGEASLGSPPCPAAPTRCEGYTEPLPTLIILFFLRDYMGKTF
jgi:hypothetical protein